jgi:hypothetical protein
VKTFLNPSNLNSSRPRYAFPKTRHKTDLQKPEKPENTITINYIFTNNKKIKEMAAVQLIEGYLTNSKVFLLVQSMSF